KKDDVDTISVIHSTLNITDTIGGFSFTTNENINFKKSDFTILEPISLKVQSGLDSLKAYQQSTANKTIEIIGFYTKEETNNSAFPNLGIARANSVKNVL